MIPLMKYTIIPTAAARGPMALGGVAGTPQIVPVLRGGVNSQAVADRRLGAVPAALASPETPNRPVTLPSQTARIPEWPVRRPMASRRVAGFYRKGQDERMDQGMGGCRVAVVGLGVRWRQAVSGDGTGCAGASASRGA